MGPGYKTFLSFTYTLEFYCFTVLRLVELPRDVNTEDLKIFKEGIWRIVEKHRNKSACVQIILTNKVKIFREVYCIMLRNRLKTRILGDKATGEDGLLLRQTE